MEIFAFFIPMAAAGMCMWSAYCKSCDKPATAAGTAASTSGASSKSGSSDSQGKADETNQVSTGFTESQLRNVS